MRKTSNVKSAGLGWLPLVLLWLSVTAVAMSIMPRLLTHHPVDDGTRTTITSVLGDTVPAQFTAFSIDDNDMGVIDGCHASLSGGIKLNASTFLPVKFEHGGLFYGLDLNAQRLVGTQWSVMGSNVGETGMQEDELRVRVSACAKALQDEAENPDGPVVRAATAALARAAAGLSRDSR